MSKLSSVVLLAVLATAALAAAPSAVGQRREAERVRCALGMPGTGLCVLGDGQLADLAAVMRKQLNRVPGSRVSLRQLLRCAQSMRRSSQATTLRVFPGGRTLHELCGQLGRTMLRLNATRQQSPESPACEFLGRVRDAREAGMPESQVQQMVRRGLERGALRVSPVPECRQLERRVEELSRDFVRGGEAVMEMAAVR